MLCTSEPLSQIKAHRSFEGDHLSSLKVSILDCPDRSFSQKDNKVCYCWEVKKLYCSPLESDLYLLMFSQITVPWLTCDCDRQQGVLLITAIHAGHCLSSGHQVVKAHKEGLLPFSDASGPSEGDGQSLSQVV